MRQQDIPEEDDFVSKTRKKETMHELQELGTALTELSRDQLKKMDLPEDLHEAVLDWHRFTAREAKRRQLQYIGRLMRSADPEPIQAGLALVRGKSAAETARMHRLERLRERLLEDEKTLHEIAETWPGADLTHLRSLRRAALKEKEASKPPKNYRLIFQFLKELDSHAEDA
ncbi:MAG: ribosome biogenesis factor YjgA [Betaproteobacteria bacterium]